MNILNLKTPGITVTPNSIELPPDTTKATWSKLLNQVVRLGNSSNWYLGDLAHFGMQNFPESVVEFCKVRQLDYSTVRHRAMVSRAIPPASRRQKLAWAVHETVCQLDLFHQNKFLTLADTEKMSVSELRQAVRLSQGQEDSSVSDGKNVKCASKYADALTDWIEHLPADFFQGEEAEARRVIWKQRLKPMAELWAKL